MRCIGLTKILVLLIGNHNIICVVKRIELLADPNHPVLCDNSRTSPKLLSYLCTFEVWIRKQSGVYCVVSTKCRFYVIYTFIASAPPHGTYWDNELKLI